jgi:hypothetical protein
MITDKQGIEWLLKKLYDDGWRYIVADNYDNIYLTNEKPVMFDDVDEVRISSCEKAMGASAFKNILPKLKRNECISVAEKLGIVDWSKVAIDTPILVSMNGTKWYKRYFALFDRGDVLAWEYGATSWSVDDADDEVYRWNYAKLAEV